MTTSVLRFVVHVASLRKGPVTFALEATPDERDQIARAFGLLDLRGLTASGEVRRAGGLIEVRGNVEAEVDQACVVTLEPVPQQVREEIAVDYLEDPDGAESGDLEDDPPDLLEGDAVDIGALVEEHLVLGLDPYPRAPGAEVPAEYSGSADDGDSPFAALAALTANGEGRGNPGEPKD